MALGAQTPGLLAGFCTLPCASLVPTAVVTPCVSLQKLLDYEVDSDEEWEEEEPGESLSHSEGVRAAGTSSVNLQPEAVMAPGHTRTGSFSETFPGGWGGAGAPSSAAPALAVPQESPQRSAHELSYVWCWGWDPGPPTS